ncbi:LOW QUALITY PROTEIN: hypothetical protein AQUCO_02200066v1 [Aquilegia coerulea]|uniref:Suppressor of forked domain-containing protein n=1 Tax=Aquilegia coerulea TaxID=218851 RepID=A0A2G5DD37_AQUCA|nr:LOW QUALITY PROTEIN: hypothetical protein AQUCO_02200066v1 [Aquilegia coerulea]
MTDHHIPRPRIVKNKNPAPIQITAEHLLRQTRQGAEIIAPQYANKQKIVDSAELADYHLIRRQEFENSIQFRSSDIKVWANYAQWEESQGEFDRALSIWERALESKHVGYKNPNLWCRYAEMEMKNRFLNHASSFIWKKLLVISLKLGRFMSGGWLLLPHLISNSYVKFEVRYNEIERARQVYERFVRCCPEVGSWIFYAKFEAKNRELARTRNCFERAVEAISVVDDEAENLFLAFAEFEEQCKEIERARCIFKFALDRLPKGKAEAAYKNFLKFEKHMETPKHYKKPWWMANPLEYDTWFDYIHMEMEVNADNKERIRDVYERAISNVPPADEKRYWQRYIYLWIEYALYEELDAQDMERTREVYRECLKRIPHHKFSFSKIWLLAAQFEIRQKNLEAARKLLGNSIGRAAKHKIFRRYIELELMLGNIDRCRTLYEKYLQWAPDSSYVWSKYVELEISLNEMEGARALVQLAVAQPALDEPELLWKNYIDFELSQHEYEKTRQIYKRLLERTQPWKVWSSYAMFEATSAREETDEENDQASRIKQKKQCLQRTRQIFEDADDYFRISLSEQKEERAVLLEEWLNLEKSFGDIGNVNIVHKRLPKKIKRRREVVVECGPAGYEEYYDYIFPEETASKSLTILENAYKWKRQKLSL